MSTIVEVDDAGELKLPGALLPESAPHTRYNAALTGDKIIVSLAVEGQPFLSSISPAQRIAAIREWAQRKPGGPGLPDNALGRDAIYE